MLAPADVPAMTVPVRWASTMASANGVPQITDDSLSWLPPVMNTPVALPISAIRSGSWASLAALRPHRDHLGGAELAEQRVVHLDHLGAERGRRGDHRDPGVLAAAGGHELLEDRASAELVLSSSDDHERSRRHDREASGCKSDAVQQQTRRLVLMRHGQPSRTGRRTSSGRSPSAVGPTPPAPAPGSRAGCHAPTMRWSPRRRGPTRPGNPWPRARVGTSSPSSTAGCTPRGPRPHSTSCRPLPTRRRR